MAASAKTVLVVVTSHAKLGDTGKDTGYYLDEVAHPVEKLEAAGLGVEYASIQGGKAPLDPSSLKLEGSEGAESNKRFWVDGKGEEKLAATQKLGDVDSSKYSAVLFAGGHGTCWDFPGDDGVKRVAKEVYEAGGVVAAVCHGPTALVDIPLSDGKQLIAGKTVTGFSNAEEEAVGLTKTVPFLLCDKLAEAGATVENGDNWSSTMRSSERVVTGQNPQSAFAVGEEIANLLKK